MSGSFNSKLSPQGEKQFQQWIQQQSQQSGRDMANDLYDYDLRGWASQNDFKTNKNPHFEDSFKKPNHPTFSDQSIYHGSADPVSGETYFGGKWTDGGFQPSKEQLQSEIGIGPENLKTYFQKAEPKSQLIFPKGL